MKSPTAQIEFAIEVFVRGFSAGRSRTFPYQASRIGPLWLMRDADRRNSADYRKEEWVAYGVDAAEADAIARRETRGRFAVCAIVAEGEPDAPIRSAYKSLGYRLLGTEGVFVQPLKRVPRRPSPMPIERVRTAELAARLERDELRSDHQHRHCEEHRDEAIHRQAQRLLVDCFTPLCGVRNDERGGAPTSIHHALGKATRSRPIPAGLLGDDAPFRQYVALDGEHIVGRVRSVDAAGATWCADMHVSLSHRRRGIGQALLCQMLRDDRARGSECSVLTASHAGALLYPHVGYERIGTLLMLVPKR